MATIVAVHSWYGAVPHSYSSTLHSRVESDARKLVDLWQEQGQMEPWALSWSDDDLACALLAPVSGTCQATSHSCWSTRVDSSVDSLQSSMQIHVTGPAVVFPTLERERREERRDEGRLRRCSSFL